MKFSILNMARIGMTVLVTILSSSLQASQQDINTTLENLNPAEFNCRKGGAGIIPEWLVEERIVPNSVVESQELWRTNAIFLKDALEVVVALGTGGNELEVISDRIIDNAQQINRFLSRHCKLEANKVEFILIEQTFTLYGYVFALQTDPSQVPAIESFLENQNKELLKELSKELKARGKTIGLLAVALELRLATLKDVAIGFVHAANPESEDFTDAYHAFNKSLFAGQEVGTVVGWASFHNF